MKPKRRRSLLYYAYWCKVWFDLHRVIPIHDPLNNDTLQIILELLQEAANLEITTITLFITAKGGTHEIREKISSCVKALKEQGKEVKIIVVNR